MAYGLSAHDARRWTVRGEWEVATLDENFRHAHDTLPDAEWYVGTTGLADTPLWAIVAVPRTSAGFQQGTPTYRRRRRSIDDLSDDQRSRYLGSSQAKAEAEAHNLDVRTWYEVAPDLKSFRGHAPERRQRPGESYDAWIMRLESYRTFEYRVYLNRDSELAFREARERRRTSAKVKAAWRRRQTGQQLSRTGQPGFIQSAFEGVELPDWEEYE